MSSVCLNRTDIIGAAVVIPGPKAGANESLFGTRKSLSVSGSVPVRALVRKCY
jgi:hypothetical protein